MEKRNILKGDNFSLRQDKLCFIFPAEVTAREILRISSKINKKLNLYLI